MDDIIFEKDYRETESAEYDKWCDEVFDRAVNCGMLKAYSEAMDKIPKIIVPEDKKNYEYLLERCDAFVKQHRGYIKGIVDYHRWHAEINMFLPFAEFDDSEDLAFLKEIAEKSQTVCFSPDEEGGIRVHIFINYFEELMSAEHKSYIEYDAIMQDKKLSELLGIPELSDEEKELALKMKGILDRIDEETRIDRSGVIGVDMDAVTGAVQHETLRGGDFLHLIITLGQAGHAGRSCVVALHGGNELAVLIDLEGRAGQGHTVGVSLIND